MGERFSGRSIAQGDIGLVRDLQLGLDASDQLARAGRLYRGCG
jgi:hypothetical protein